MFAEVARDREKQYNSINNVEILYICTQQISHPKPYSTMNKMIGHKIREYRKNRGLTLEELSSRVNISRSSLQRIENGESNSWVNHIEELCNVFEIEPEELLIDQDRWIQNINEQTNGVQNAFVINHYLSEKVIEQYEIRIKEKDELIKELKEKLRKFEE